MTMHVVSVVLMVCSLGAVTGKGVLLLGSSVHFMSSQVELLAIGDELAARGHKVYSSVAVFPNGESEAKKMARPNISQVTYKVYKDYSFVANIDKNMMENKFAGDKLFHLKALSRLWVSFADECEEALADEEFLSKLKELQLDMVVVYRFPFSPCLHLIPYHLKVSYVSFGTGLDPWLGGSPSLPSFYYNAMLNYSDRMNFWQRLLNTLFYIAGSLANSYDLGVRSHSHLLARYAPGLRSFLDVVDQSQFFFVAREHVLQWPLPTMPNVVTIPSVGCAAPKPLPKDLEQIVGSSKHGVVVVSFGSVASYIPNEVILKMATALGQLKQDVIWKFPAKGVNIADYALKANIHPMTWIPQNDLLGHANTKLFITHCGNNGQYEAVYSGVPMVAFPLFAEQDHNAFRAEYRGLAITLDILTFTAQELVHAINTVIENKTYDINVKKLSAIMRDSPMTPRETVAYWIEHVIKHGHQHLRSHAMDLAWYEYFMVDVIAFIFFIFVFLLFLFRKMCQFFFKLCCKKGSKVKVKSN